MSAIHDIYIKIIEKQVWDASICILQYIYHITIHFSASLVAFKVKNEFFTTFFFIFRHILFCNKGQWGIHAETCYGPFAFFYMWNCDNTCPEYNFSQSSYYGHCWASNWAFFEGGGGISHFCVPSQVPIYFFTGV